MKKYIILFLILLSSIFLFSQNVNAETNYTFDKEIYFVNLYGMTYDEIYNTISEYYSEFKSEDQIIKMTSFYSGIYNYFINNYGEDYYVYSGYATNGYPAYRYEDMYTVKKSSVSNLKFALTVNDYGKIIVSSNLSTWKESIFSVDTTNKTISFLRSNTNQKIAYFMNTDETHSSGYINNCHFYLSNIDKNFIYSTSLLSTMSYNMDDGVGNIVETITMNGKTYSNSDEIFLVNEGLTQNKIYQYEEQIDTSNLSYIKIIYDTTGSTYDDYSFVIMNNVSNKLREAYIEKSYEWGICLDENTCYDSYIYRDNIYYTSEANMYSMSFPFKFEDAEHGYYYDTHELDYFYAYYDVSSISDVVTLSIDSTKQFSVEFGYMEDYVDTFVEVDLKNYAGIVLFPKVNLYNGDYVFYLKNADVNVHHYYENNLVNIYKNIMVETYRIDQVEYQDRNRYYLIENNKVDQDSYISFDTRYFSYQLVNSTSESITITNPNTNEDQNIDSIDNSHLNYDIQHKLDNVDGAISSVNEFIDNIKQYLIVISDLISYTYNNLNSHCQTLIVVTFIVLLIVGLSLLFRR